MTSNYENIVRFYYLAEPKERAKVLAWDDYEEIEADLHEDHLIQNGVFYRRDTPPGPIVNVSLYSSPRIS